MWTLGSQWTPRETPVPSLHQSLHAACLLRKQATDARDKGLSLHAASAQATEFAQMAALGLIAFCTVHIGSCLVARLHKYIHLSLLLCLACKACYCKVLEMPFSQHALIIVHCTVA